jgi:hypothetical protein
MRMRLGVGGPLLVAIVAALVALGPAAESASAVEFTFIGDSKAAGIEFSKKAKRLLRRGHDVHRDLKVCRRLVAPSCEYNGVVPLTALQVIHHRGTDLGAVVVIDVGYNDSSTTYRGQLNRVMRAALSYGVRGVVWVNLKAVRTDYSRINRIIKRARDRWPRLYLANWNKYSRGHPAWFASWDDERIHLTSAGAVGLVKLVRKYVPRAAQGPRPGTAAQVETGLAPTSETDGTTETEGVTTTEPATSTESADADLTAGSPPVGPNLDPPDDGSTGLSSVLPFAAGAALMLFLIFVTIKRRGAADR